MHDLVKQKRFFLKNRRKGRRREEAGEKTSVLERFPSGVARGYGRKEGRTQSRHNTSRNTDKSGQKSSPLRCHVTVIRALLLFSSLPPPTHLAVARRNAHVRPTLFRDKQGGKTVRRSKKSTSAHVSPTCLCTPVYTVCVRGQCKRETEGIFLERREETCTSTKYIIAPRGSRVFVWRTIRCQQKGIIIYEIFNGKVNE